MYTCERENLSSGGYRVCRKKSYYGFYDELGVLPLCEKTLYNQAEIEMAASAFAGFAYEISSDIFLQEYLGGSIKDKKDKIDFSLQAQQRSFTVQLKTRRYADKRRYLNDITVRNTECSDCTADVLLEAVHDNRGVIKDLHFLNWKKLKAHLDKDVLIPGWGKLTTWNEKTGILRNTGKNDLRTIDIQKFQVSYGEGSSYFFIENPAFLGLKNPIYILKTFPESDGRTGIFVPVLPLQVLEALDVDLDNPNIIDELPQ